MKFEPGTLVRYRSDGPAWRDSLPRGVFLVLGQVSSGTDPVANNLIRIWNLGNNKIGWDYAYAYENIGGHYDDSRTK
jgi:hypothetical protein